jgi:hypothetical protein
VSAIWNGAIPRLMMSGRIVNAQRKENVPPAMALVMWKQISSKNRTEKLKRQTI